MTIHIDPNRIRTTSGSASKAGERRRSAVDDSPLPPKPARAHVNFVPEPESLRTLIANAVLAFKRGITWDRGSILNLLV